jgi:hypothetical protein
MFDMDFGRFGLPPRPGTASPSPSNTSRSLWPWAYAVLGRDERFVPRLAGCPTCRSTATAGPGNCETACSRTTGFEGRALAVLSLSVDRSGGALEGGESETATPGMCETGLVGNAVGGGGACDRPTLLPAASAASTAAEARLAADRRLRASRSRTTISSRRHSSSASTGSDWGGVLACKGSAESGRAAASGGRAAHHYCGSQNDVDAKT